MNISGFQRIALLHDYSQIAFSETDACLTCQVFDPIVPCDSPSAALIFAMYELGEGQGSLKERIIATALAYDCDFSSDVLESQFTLFLKRGVFTTLIPPRINWFVAPPPNRYTFSSQMDRTINNKTEVQTLLQLVGGLRGSKFSQYFNSATISSSKEFNALDRTSCLR